MSNYSCSGGCCRRRRQCCRCCHTVRPVAAVVIECIIAVDVCGVAAYQTMHGPFVRPTVL